MDGDLLASWLCLGVANVGIWGWTFLPDNLVGPVSAMLGFLGGMGMVHFTWRGAL